MRIVKKKNIPPGKTLSDLGVCLNCGSPMCGICWDCFVSYPAFSARNSTPAIISINIGIPEKRKGGEAADRQYHGFRADEDEW